VFRSLSGLSIGIEDSASLCLVSQCLNVLFDLVHSDDFSRHTWIYFMKHRSEVLSIYKNFFLMIHSHFDTSIRAFHVDSVGEYLSDALR
jgi:hypothetical protein